ncbi:MAG: 4Fe-4S dicluster domain-containing protein [Lachnospiraceae bacterium]|nr:4Fe-4S dicluster domain-containing protein [Lachnospiraceae bacterium]
MTICYFTGTGNCLYVARRIGGTLLSIPQLMRQEKIVIEDDAVGIVAPVYAVEMPMMVKAFLEKAEIKTEYFFFIYTYGMGYAEAFTHVAVVSEKKGLDLKYINAIQMVDNYLPFFDQKEQIETLPEKNVEGQIAQVVKDISERKLKQVLPTEENLAEMEHWTRTHAAGILKKDTALGYTVNDACIRCGICAKVCPANNITVTEEAVQFSDHCEVCYACLHNCPKSAIHMELEAGATHFRNKFISLSDIIKANE